MFATPPSPPPVQAEAPPPRALRREEWATMPDVRAVTAVFPLRAASENVPGRALLTCTVAASGLLEACQARDEAPTGYGFGQAALLLSKFFRARADLVPAGTPVRIWITLKTADGQDPPPPVGTPAKMMIPLSWSVQPSTRDLQAVTPAGPGGTAQIACRLETSGRLRDCRVIAEAPAGRGYGAAALRLATGFVADVRGVAPEALPEAGVYVPVVFPRK